MCWHIWLCKLLMVCVHSWNTRDTFVVVISFFIACIITIIFVIPSCRYETIVLNKTYSCSIWYSNSVCIPIIDNNPFIRFTSLNKVLSSPSFCLWLSLELLILHFMPNSIRSCLILDEKKTFLNFYDSIFKIHTLYSLKHNSKIITFQSRSLLEDELF